jgi:hypothetical protein
MRHKTLQEEDKEVLLQTDWFVLKKLVIEPGP